MRKLRVLVTGGCGFIGSHFIVRGLHKEPCCGEIVNLDLLTPAGSLTHLASVANHPNYVFVHGDIRNAGLVETLCRTHHIDTCVHFAAETHVDNSIAHPHSFYQTNVEGTLTLLNVVRLFPHIHVHHISTDEVFGSLTEGMADIDTTPYRPNSPYAASKAAADHLVRAYQKTYGMQGSISYCTNNYGPRQSGDKLIPKAICACLHNTPFPLYGSGEHIRDWLFVQDHVEGLWKILQGRPHGQSFAFAGTYPLSNRALLSLLMAAYAGLCQHPLEQYLCLIETVADRPGHDFRYALDTRKTQMTLGWKPTTPFDHGLRQTIEWFIQTHATLTC